MPVDLKRPGDLQRLDGRVPVVPFVDSKCMSGLNRLANTFGFGEFAHERHCHTLRPRLHMETHLHARVCREHIVLPRRVSEYLAGIAGRRRSTWRITSYAESLDERAIDADIKLMRRTKAANVVDVIPQKTDLEPIFTIGREIVSKR